MRAAKQVAKLLRSYIRYMTVEMDRMKGNYICGERLPKTVPGTIFFVSLRTVFRF